MEKKTTDWSCIEVEQYELSSTFVLDPRKAVTLAKEINENIITTCNYNCWDKTEKSIKVCISRNFDYYLGIVDNSQIKNVIFFLGNTQIKCELKNISSSLNEYQKIWVFSDRHFPIQSCFYTSLSAQIEFNSDNINDKPVIGLGIICPETEHEKLLKFEGFAGYSIENNEKIIIFNGVAGLIRLNKYDKIFIL